MCTLVLGVRPYDQAKYEEMLSKHSVDSMRSRLKYDKLAGKHLELQTDYEALQESLRSKPQHTSRSSKVGNRHQQNLFF